MLTNAILPAIDPVMIFKEHDELPHSFKYCIEYIPKSKQMVKVINTTMLGNELFLNVRFSGLTATLNVRHFRTLNKHKLRERLLKQPMTEKIIKMLTKI
jgi:hypothetical protein